MSQPVTNKSRLTSRPKLVLALALIFVLLAAAVVVGAVLGSRSKSHIASASPQSTATSTDAPTSSTTTTGSLPTASSPSSTELRGNSALSVTIWTSGSSGYSVRLFFQGADGKIRLSSYDSSDGKWQSPMVLDIEAKDGTTLGAASIAEQYYFHFTDTKSVRDSYNLCSFLC